MVSPRLRSALFVIVLIISVLAVWALVSLFDNSVVSHQGPPQIDVESNVSARCIPEDTGWSCSFDASRVARGTYVAKDPVLEAYEKKCEETGGKWNCYGFCRPEYHHYCDYSFKDAKSLCISSLQCGGKCIGIAGVGVCSDTELRECDRYTEIVFGVPVNNFVLCD